MSKEEGEVMEDCSAAPLASDFGLPEGYLDLRVAAEGVTADGANVYTLGKLQNAVESLPPLVVAEQCVREPQRRLRCWFGLHDWRDVPGAKPILGIGGIQGAPVAHIRQCCMRCLKERLG